MVRLRESQFEELPTFCEMERQPHAHKFVNATPLEVHRKSFADDNVTYLSIDDADGKLVGYFILVLEEDRDNIEFRRILVDENQTGIGQAAIVKMEQYCIERLGASRIWLDVYDDNERGKHIYEKMNYKRFKTEVHSERLLRFYQKSL